jgi:four helix bundle protein
VQNYRNLKVSQKARSLVGFVYESTAGFPQDELYGLTKQMRCSARGIGLAIAEGCGRDTTKELIRYLTIANGEAQELECAAEQAIDLKVGSAMALRQIMERAVEIQKMLCSLIRTLKAR